MNFIRGLVRAVSMALVFCLAGMISRAAEPPAASRPGRNLGNVLLVTIDTLRADRLSCYNRTNAQTPHLDALAARGALFLNAFAHTPTTLPSHSSILLGVTPLYHGVHDNHHFIVREELLSLAELLKTNGYATAAFVGAFPLDSRFGLTQGFDVYDDNYGSPGNQEFSYVERRAEVVVEKALAWLAGRAAPWFLWIHCFDPHQKYDPPEPFKTEYKDRPYDGEVAYVDSALGRVFDVLDKGRLDRNSLVIVTGDHGESLGEHGEATHGYFAYNSTLRVPLIIAGPGIKPSKTEAQACHADIFPTVCDLLGLERPSHLQGLSLLPAIRGKRMPERAIYVESLYPYYGRGWAPLRGFVRGSEKYLDSPIPELYDLARDFEEMDNLAGTRRLEPYKAALDGLIKENTGSPGGGERRADRETLEKLRSLGYTSSPQAPRRETFTPRDDLKTLLPYQNKLMLAMGEYHKGRIPEGIRLLQEILAERKDFDLAYTYLAALFKDEGRYKDAVGVLREGYARCPQSYKVITTLGIFLTEAGEYDAALAVLAKGRDIMDYDPELWNYLGMAYWKKGDLENAKEAYRKCLELDANYPIAFNNLGSVYLTEALKRNEPEPLEKAMASFRKAIELDPRYASAYNGLGAAYRKAGDVEKSIACWEKAVEIDADFSFALYNLGLAYFSKGDGAKAFDALTRYKAKAYRNLPEKERLKLDALIERARKGS